MDDYSGSKEKNMERRIFDKEIDARWAAFFEAMGIQYEYHPCKIAYTKTKSLLMTFRINVKRRQYEGEDRPTFVFVDDSPGYHNEEIKKLVFELVSERFDIIIVKDIPDNDNTYFNEFNESSLSVGYFNYRYLDGDEYCAIFSTYKGEPWICGFDHDEYDGGKSYNDAATKALNANVYKRFELRGKYNEG